MYLNDSTCKWYRSWYADSRIRQPIFSRNYFELYFGEKNNFALMHILLKCDRKGSNWQAISIVASNGLVPSRQQAITCINDDPYFPPRRSGRCIVGLWCQRLGQVSIRRWLAGRETPVWWRHNISLHWLRTGNYRYGYWKVIFEPRADAAKLQTNRYVMNPLLVDFTLPSYFYLVRILQMP